jgi:hypothetical protein
MSLGEGFIDLKLDTLHLDAGLKTVAAKFSGLSSQINAQLSGGMFGGGKTFGVMEGMFGGLDKGSLNTVSAGLGDARKSVTDMSNAFGEMGRTSKSAITGLEGGFARTGAITGIAVMAIARIARGIAEGAAKAHELADAFRSGAMSANDVGLELAKSLPIIGSLVKAAIDLQEAIAPVGVDLSKQHGIALDMVTAAKRERDLAVAATDIDRQRVAEAQRYKDAKEKIAAQEREAAAEGRMNSVEANKAANQALRFAEETNAANVAKIDKAAADLKAKGIADVAERTKRVADEVSEAAERREKDAADATAAKWKTISERIAALGKEVQTPIEVYRDGMKEISELMATGLMGKDVFARQAAKLKDELGKTNLNELGKTNLKELPVDVAVGGRLGLEDIAKNIQVAQLKSSKDERQLAAAEETAKQTRESNEHLKRMADVGFAPGGSGRGVFS